MAHQIFTALRKVPKKNAQVLAVIGNKHVPGTDSKLKEKTKNICIVTGTLKKNKDETFNK